MEREKKKYDMLFAIFPTFQPRKMWLVYLVSLPSACSLDPDMKLEAKKANTQECSGQVAQEGLGAML